MGQVDGGVVESILNEILLLWIIDEFRDNTQKMMVVITNVYYLLSYIKKPKNISSCINVN